jgi:5S rRNA maturation endonuclease (ribonuclease M5)
MSRRKRLLILLEDLDVNGGDLDQLVSRRFLSQHLHVHDQSRLCDAVQEDAIGWFQQNIPSILVSRRNDGIEVTE